MYYVIVDWRQPNATTKFVLFIFLPPTSRLTRCTGILPRRYRPAPHRPNCIPSPRPTVGWLLRPPIKRKPSKLKTPSHSLFQFFPSLDLPPKTTSKRPPHTFRPSHSRHRHYRSVGCCVEPTSGGHPRPVLRSPSLNFSMGAISAPKTRESAAMREIPGAGRLR